MIVLDTHILIWWASDRPELTPSMAATIRAHQTSGLGISAITCWEVAKLVERGRLDLSMAVDEWLNVALTLAGIRLIELSPEIAVASTQLPGEFHRDPADQIIVATARVLDIPLLTADQRILAYPHVRQAQA